MFNASNSGKVLKDYSKKSITEQPWRQQVYTTVSKLAEWLKFFQVREPPLTFRLVIAKGNDLCARLLSGGISGYSKKYHHWSALN